MSCNCLKNVVNEFDRALELARYESKIDKTDYIVYELDSKVYHDRKECWQKAGRKGKIRAIIFYI